MHATEQWHLLLDRFEESDNCRHRPLMGNYCSLTTNKNGSDLFHLLRIAYEIIIL